MTINALKMINLRPRNRTGGDCVCLALTFLTGASYSDIEDNIKRRYSKYQAPEGTKAHGVPTARIFKDEFVMEGYHFKRVFFRDKVHRIHSFLTEYKSGSYLICIHRHALCVRDGQQFDANDSSVNALIEYAWKVEKL